MQSATWHSDTIEHVQQALDVGPGGLTDSEAARRLSEQGPNEIVGKDSRSPLSILASQFTNVMVLVLLVAAIVSGLTGDLKDALVIGFILVMNAVLGFVQENRAEKAMAALKAMAVPTARVTRGGIVREISSRELVAGDLVHLEAGVQVCADARLVEVASLNVDEAALTGESVPVEKGTSSIADNDAPLGDRRSMVYMGTAVVSGRGRAVVVATGMRTELGKIATMIQSGEDKKTPLQVRLSHLGKWLAGVALAVCVLIFAVGVVRGEDPKEVFLAAISLAVAAIPESLPAIITVALALGAQRMVRRNALIRRLNAVETLGCVTTVCSDKTGTLTQNQMTVTRVRMNDVLVKVNGTGYSPIGALEVAGRPIDGRTAALDLAIKGLALCNDSVLVEPDGNGSDWRVIGDPTEGALVVLAAKAGLEKPLLEAEMPRLAELGFDSDRKRMTTFHRVDGRFVSFTKGAVDTTLALCARIAAEDEARPITDLDRERVLRWNDDSAAQGERVLAIAYREWDELPADLNVEACEQDLTYLGLVSMIDPPREEAGPAVATCRSAGIRPVLITGDHRLTAEAVAKSIGVFGEGDKSMTGSQLDAIDDYELAAQVEDIAVYSRVSPLHKMRIVEALQRRGHVVAMTGDGVNDAPALKRADIGVAMGITGTDVSKEASDMVLTNDNFATIVSAVAEGRVIYDNLRKFVRYMLTTNSAEVLVVALAMFSGLPLPLLAIQILWVNLVTDGVPALALGFEPPERNVMRRPPRNPRESLFARGMWQHIVWAGLLMAAGTLGVMLLGLANCTLPETRTMVFLTLACFQMAHVLAIRSESDSTFTIGFWSNRYLTGAVIVTMALQIAIVYVPFLQAVFQTVSLSIWQLALCIVVSSTIFFAVEIEKAIFRRSDRRIG